MEPEGTVRMGVELAAGKIAPADGVQRGGNVEGGTGMEGCGGAAGGGG